MNQNTDSNYFSVIIRLIISSCHYPFRVDMLKEFMTNIWRKYNQLIVLQSVRNNLSFFFL